MKYHTLILILIISLAISQIASAHSDGTTEIRVHNFTAAKVRNGSRRILHQPLYPVSSTPLPPEDESESSPSPSTPDSSGSVPDQPFFPEVPNGGSSDSSSTTTTTTPNQSPPPPAATDGSVPIPTATQPTKPTKKVAIAVSVIIVTLGMLSALAFYIYRHRAKHHGEEQKLVGSNPQRYTEESRAPPSSFLYMGTVDPSTQISGSAVNHENIANVSPYHRLDSGKMLDRYRPSPDLQPLPPLSKAPMRNSPKRNSSRKNSPTVTMSSSSLDEESREANFYTPQGSVASFDGGTCTPASRQGYRTNSSTFNSARGESQSGGSLPYSKRTSPRSRHLAPSPDVVKHAIIPSIKVAVPTSSLSTPPLPPRSQEDQSQHDQKIETTIPQRPRFSRPPPLPNVAILHSITSSSQHSAKFSASPPPPPPPPTRPSISLCKVGSVETKCSSPLTQNTSKPQSWAPNSNGNSQTGRRETPKSAELDDRCNSLGRPNADDTESSRPKLKPLHWDKVRATSDRATVWDQLESSSFRLNEDMMESLFGW